MRKIYALIILSLIVSTKLFAQLGELQGKVTDDKTNEGIPFAAVVLELNGTQKGVGETDDDGRYTIKPIVPGTYTLRIILTGYQPVTITGITVVSDRFSFQDAKMKVSISELPEIFVSTEKLIEPDKTSTGSTLTKDEIEHIATRNTNSYASLTAGVSQKDDGKELNIAGARSNATQYIIDGIKVRGSINLPQSSIEQLTVLTGGIPAKYGDALGGIVNVTTRGPSQEYSGSVELVTSQFLDPYGYNLASANLSGPLMMKEKGTSNAKSIIGFFVSGEWEHAKDGSPSAVQLYKVNDDYLSFLEQNPLTLSPTSSGFVPTASFITADNLEETSVRQNNVSDAYRLSAKLDFDLNKYTSLTIGGNAELSRYVNWDYNSSLLAFNSANEAYKENTYRGFIRFVQRFPTSQNKEKQSVFQNAYYSIQADYTKFYQNWGDENHGTNAFDYGYVGKFETLRQAVYGIGQDSITGLNGWLLQGYADTLVNFTPGTLNPLLSNYTSQYYSLAPGTDGYYRSIFDIANGGGLINGSLPVSTTTIYSMFLNTGYPTTNYGTRDNDQFHFALNASVDIVKPGKGDKSKHALEFGFEYEQRTERRYLVAPIGLWGLARQLTNQHILGLDKENPLPVYDEFGVFLL